MRRIRTATAIVVYGTMAALSIAAQSSAPATVSASAASAAAKAREYHRANQHKIIAELREWLAIPNVAADTANIQRAGERLKQMLVERGVRAQLLPIAGRGPVVFGELLTPSAKRTVVFYGHYDGQPTDPARWTGTTPWTPALRTGRHDQGAQLIPFPEAGTAYEDDWRIYARSASDDKSPIVAILTALDALRANRIPLSVNVKFILDGEEEAGSEHLEATLLAHRELIRGDVLLAADGPVHQSGRPLIFFGNRGVTDMEITVYGPTRPLHSGHYGNWAPNPAMRLAQLLASMKDAEGRVLVEGYYDDVVALSGSEKKALEEMPSNDAELMRELGLAGVDGSGKKLVELLNLPSLNIRGMRSAYTGAQSQNIVPTEATVSLDCRLVRNVTPEKTFARIVAHVRKQGYYVTDKEPTAEERAKYPRIAKVTGGDGYPASRTPMDLPAAQALVRAAEAALGEPVVKMPTIGGSAPMHIFDQFQLPVIGLPIVNHDNNQHSENENLRLGNFWRGIELFAALLADLQW